MKEERSAENDNGSSERSVVAGAAVTSADTRTEFVKGERESQRKSPCSPRTTLILIHDDDDVDKDDGGDAVSANLRDVPPRSEKKASFPATPASKDAGLPLFLILTP